MGGAQPEKKQAPIDFGKYQLVERLGRGGMAEVWKARITGPAGFARTLVVKRILPQLVEDPAFVEMFVGEARLSARLNHANIVTVFELGEFDGEYYLAMEYVRGHDLMTVLRTQAPRGVLSPGFGACVLREVARGLGHAHALTDEAGHPLRIIHRDLSPSNVMLGFDGGVKLLDFGIAKAMAEANDKSTLTGTLKGKLGYMSPEQAEAAEVDHRTDLFSLGVLLFECVTGRRLFKGVHDVATLTLVKAARIPVPSSINRDIPPQLDEICLKALARNPDDRYQSAEELAAALDRIAHQYDWGPERLITLMRSLFPTEFSHTPTLTPSREREIVLEADLEVPRRSRAWLWAALLGLLAVGGAVGAWRLLRRPAPPVAPPVVVAPPVAAPPVVVSPLAPPPPVVAPPVVVTPIAAPPAAPVESGKRKHKSGKSRSDLLKGDFVDPFEDK
jgi:serine/threonine protein kinase